MVLVPSAEVSDAELPGSLCEAKATLLSHGGGGRGGQLLLPCPRATPGTSCSVVRASELCQGLQTPPTLGAARSTLSQATITPGGGGGEAELDE